jgi:menaquinol-cytochrome c reductase iron-sulfur subunit
MAQGESELRRSFLKLVAGGVAAGIGVLAAIPGLGFLAHPLRATTVTGGDEPIRVSAVPADVQVGRPVRVDIVGERRDGWTRFDRMKLGAAWLVRTPAGRVRAFSTVCPHLGCGIDWDETTEKFACPCHKSAFDADGRCLFGPSPRGMDELEIVASDAEIRVRYRRFKVAIKEKEPLG